MNEFYAIQDRVTFAQALHDLMVAIDLLAEGGEDECLQLATEVIDGKAHCGDSHLLMAEMLDTVSALDFGVEVEEHVLDVVREFLAGTGTVGSPLCYLVTTFSEVDLRFYLKESFLNVGVSVADTVVERFIYQFPPVAITPMEILSCGGDGSLVLHVPEHIIALPALPYYKVRSISVEGDTEKLLVLDNAWAPVFAKCKMLRGCGLTLEKCVLTRPFVEVLRRAFPTGDFSLSLTMTTTLVALPALAQITLHAVLI